MCRPGHKDLEIKRHTTKEDLQLLIYQKIIYFLQFVIHLGTRSGSPTSADEPPFNPSFSEGHFTLKKVDVRIKPVKIPKKVWDLQFKKLFASPTKDEVRVGGFSTWIPSEVEAGILPCSVDGELTSSSSDQEASDLREVLFVASKRFYFY